MSKADFGLVGLGVMGENLDMNLASKGFTVAVYDREPDVLARFMNGRAKGKSIVGCESVQALCSALTKPRRILMMIRAGAPVDGLIAQLLPHLEPGDVLIDGGNTHYPDTARRMAECGQAGVLYVGMGVSGGEEGALKGPSLMPGGSPAAWPLVKPVLQAICAHVDGQPCCDWIGEGGAGHFVKMVHNGIEYGDMQLICEAYQLLRDGLGLTPHEMSDVFARWNEGALDSYLIQITRDILRFDDADGQPLVDKILDAAGQKGTGKWTAIEALNEGVPLTLISEAVSARSLSAMKDERVAAARVLSGPAPLPVSDREAFIEDVRQALYASKIVSYAQGYQLMHAAARTYGWNLNYGGIALMWRGGCIIRSAFLGRIREAFTRDPALENLMLDPFFAAQLQAAQAGWRRTCAHALLSGVPAPAFTAALSYFDGCRCARLPANLLQAQRDYFGAHTYERVDAPRGEHFHTNWTGAGGSTSSEVYNA
ncbi:MAG: decarboxylating NADP(+)-dependent phosphogluconate dehydrogenase [Eubacteriales bacterium]|nr:decarboxylating NADP(+)-dependent phosphogluconate dehydrogenase [Eubacteriales bacterium]